MMRRYQYLHPRMKEKMEVKILITNILCTQRLLLRRMTEDDSHSLFTIWSDPDVTKFMNIENFSNENQAKEMIRFLNELSAQNKAMRYTIMEAKTNQIIGSCGFNTLDYENRKAEIGYELDSTFWGRGYGTEAISCLVDYAFNQLHFIRIEAEVEPENLPSVKVLQKLHFTLEGTRRKSKKTKGKSANLHIYSRLQNKSLL